MTRIHFTKIVSIAMNLLMGVGVLAAVVVSGQATAQATCSLAASWENQSATAPAATTASVGEQAAAVVTYSNCGGLGTGQLSVLLDGQPVSTSPSRPIQRNPADRLVHSLTFSRAGQYTVRGTFTPTSGQPQTTESGSITVSGGGAPTPTPTPTTTPTPSPATGAPSIGAAQGWDTRGGGQAVTNNSYVVEGQTLVLYGTNFFPPGGGKPTIVINTDTIDPARISGPYQAPSGGDQINIQMLMGQVGPIDIELSHSGQTSRIQFRIAPAATVPTPSPTGNPQPTPPAGGSTNNTCDQLKNNFNSFGGDVPVGLPAYCYSPGGAVAQAIKVAFALVAALAVLAIVIGGYRYMTSAGDPKKAEAGKKTIFWALAGLGLVLFAYAIVAIVTRLTTTGTIF